MTTNLMCVTASPTNIAVQSCVNGVGVNHVNEKRVCERQFFMEVHKRLPHVPDKLGPKPQEDLWSHLQ